jgi:hypothetical protein
MSRPKSTRAEWIKIPRRIIRRLLSPTPLVLTLKMKGRRLLRIWKTLGNL